MYSCIQEFQINVVIRSAAHFISYCYKTYFMLYFDIHTISGWGRKKWIRFLVPSTSYLNHDIDCIDCIEGGIDTLYYTGCDRPMIEGDVFKCVQGYMRQVPHSLRIS